MINGVLTTTDLQEITAYDRVGDIRRCLEAQGIRYFHSRGGIWTTIALVNKAGGIVAATDQDSYSPDIFR